MTRPVDAAPAAVPGAPVPVAFDLALDLRIASFAAAELVRRTAGPGASWGYVLGVEGALAVLPATAAIDAELLRLLPAGFALSFAKVAAGLTPDVDEDVHHRGFHLDTHPSITGETGTELDRILLNLGRGPRTVRFARTTRFELAARGRHVHRGDYQVVDLPGDVDVEVVEIPGLTPSRVCGLRFAASVVPHVGLDDDQGYFLVSYERCHAFTPEAAPALVGAAAPA